MRPSRPIVPDLVHEVLGREDELETAVLDGLRERLAAAVVENRCVDADLAVLRQLRVDRVSEGLYSHE